jgi:type IV pilus assembly protein PilM
MLFSKKKIQAFGMDISDSSIKIMQLSRHRDSYFPVAHSHLDLPPTMIANHMISDQQKLADYISRAITAAKHVSSRYVVVSVPEAKSFVRILEMPKMGDVELEGAIPWELEQDIPVPIDQVYMDWQIVKEGETTNQVLVMSTPKDYIDTLVGSLKMANLKPIALELESLATARALIGPEDENQATMVIDMTTSLTSFIIVSGKGVLEYTSNIPIGGNHLTESVARNLGITPKEAELVKRESGLLTESKKGNIKQALLPIIDNIVDEIRNVVKFHEDHSKLSPAVNKIILCGGAANLAGLPDYIAARLNIGIGKPIDRIVLGDPWINAFHADKRPKLDMTDQEAVAYSTVIGLALRGVNS